MAHVHRPSAAANHRPARHRLIVGALAALAGSVLLIPAAGGGPAPDPAPAAGAASGSVLVTSLSEPITPVIANHLRDGMAQAEREGHQAYVIELDTPGGLDTSMRTIIRAMLASPVPVVVYTSPPGARSASAGAVISIAAHVNAMAPGTSIGAATPVTVEGEAVGAKVVEDAAAYAEELARIRGRDVDFAAAMVREGRALPAERAVEVGAVDLLAPSLGDLLVQLEGRTVEVAEGRTVTLGPTDVVERHDLSFTRQILQFLADPTVTFILLSIGTLGIIYELASPGVGVGGTVGVTSLLLALFSLAVIPVNVVGVVFLLLALALFAAELFVPGTGIAAAGGAVMLVLAALFLFDEQAIGVDVRLAAVIPVAIVMFLAVVFAGRLALRARQEKPLAETELTGRVASVRMSDDEALVFVNGSWWEATPTTGALRDGQRVRVVDRQGLHLLVEPVDAAPPDDAGPTRAGTPTERSE
jgi:membrane-bound serine protease (ClpP class)